MARRTPSERFWEKVTVRGPSECWPWLASRMSVGYGQFFDGQRLVGAHRFAYEDRVGPIPVGMEIDHQCHSADEKCRGGIGCPHRLCVNPAHLEPVTHRLNQARGRTLAAANLSKTHCPKGHPYDARNKEGTRFCRQCRNAWHLAYYHEHKDQT